MEIVGTCKHNYCLQRNGYVWHFEKHCSNGLSFLFEILTKSILVNDERNIVEQFQHRHSRQEFQTPSLNFELRTI